MRGGWVERGTVMIRPGRAHFAFFRGYLDGLEIGDLAARYLTSHLPSSRADFRPDLRLAKSAVYWIRSQLLVLARRSLTPADVRLLELAPALLLVEYDYHAPSLEAFRQEHDTDGMYSETELIALYEQAHGDRSTLAERRAARNRRLRQRQHQALNRLEALTAVDPQPTDRVDGWLDPAVAGRLQAVGVERLAELVELIDRHGYRWYCKVPRIGIMAALQIGRWLQDDSVRSIAGLTPAGRPYQPPRALSVAVPPALRTAIVALEYFCMPSRPANEAGKANRHDVLDQSEAVRLVAQYDNVAAIHHWLTLQPANRHTWRAYRKEAERFLLWTVLERGKTLCTLNAEDCAAFLDFLAMIGTATEIEWHSSFRMPQTAWIGVPGAGRQSRFWRPFHGPLGIPSQRQAVTILKGMLAWLTEQGYVAINPMTHVSRTALPQVSDSAMRALSEVEWQALRDHLSQRPTGLTENRLRCLLALAAGAGLRLSELALLRRGHVQAAFQDDHGTGAPGAALFGSVWSVRLIDRAGVVRVIALSRAVMVEVESYFLRRGFTDFATVPAQAPMIAALPAKPNAARGIRVVTASTNDASVTEIESALTIDRIHRIIKRLFEDAAAHCQTKQPAVAARLKAASSDWLRLTALSTLGGDSFTLDRGPPAPADALLRPNA